MQVLGGTTMGPRASTAPQTQTRMKMIASLPDQVHSKLHEIFEITGLRVFLGELEWKNWAEQIR